jgi:hypothetical protein
MRVVQADPSVTGWIQEMEHRGQWHKHLLNKGLLARCPHDFLGAAITDKQPVRDAEAWYQQVNQQQQTPMATVTQPLVQYAQTRLFGGFGGPPQFGSPGSLQPFGQTAMAVDQELPDEPARKSGGREVWVTQRTNRAGRPRTLPLGQQYRPEEPRSHQTDREPLRARSLDRHGDRPTTRRRRAFHVAQAGYVGRGDTHEDVEKAMEYILKR